MGETYHIVDHLKLEYSGVFDTREMFRMFTRWIRDAPYEKGGDYVSEQNTSHGKCIEYIYFPWLKDTDFVRKFMRIRMLLYDLKKVDIIVDGQKKRMDQGRIIIYIDGFLEYDYEGRWTGPFFMLLRTSYIKFFYRRYTKMLERVIIDDCHGLYDAFERFFNMYRSYRPIKETPHFYY